MSKELEEKVARAISSAPWHVGEGHEVCIDMARAALAVVREAMAEPTLEMQSDGMIALCMYNSETDGPAKPHEECKTPDDWMMRGANIAGRMQSGHGMNRVWAAMLSASPLGEQ